MEVDERTHELLWVKVLMPRGYVVVGALYHPPKPIYQTDLLLQQLEVLDRDFPDSLIILAGDLNQLKDSQIVEATRLIPKVHQPTHGSNILDRLYVSEVCFAMVRVLS